MHWRPRTLIWSGRGKSGDGDRRRYQQWCEVGQFDTHGGTPNWWPRSHFGRRGKSSRAHLAI
jgi:hypothetical protein